jgi:vacuolar-type H+-ATPase subunit I/STV1
MSELFDLNSSNEKSSIIPRSTKSSKSKSKLEIVDSDQEISLNNLDLDVLANSEKIMNVEQEAQIDLNESLESSKKSNSVISVKKPKKKKTKLVSQENTNENIRSLKNEFLFKINKINSGSRYSQLNLTMNDSLDDIRNEYERICKEIQVNTSVKFYKTVLSMGCRGIEMLNAQYDPLGIDLEGYGESMTFTVDTPSYDEVLSELAEKYKSMGNVSPELKLVGLLAMSGFGFVASKKMAKTMEENKRFQSQNQARYQASPQTQNHEYDTDTDSDDSSAKIPIPEETFSSTLNIDTEINESDLNAVLDKMNKNTEDIQEQKIIEIAPKRGRPKKIK